jgi:NADH:ubiquinone reductase (non-electrogenic)
MLARQITTALTRRAAQSKSVFSRKLTTSAAPGPKKRKWGKTLMVVLAIGGGVYAVDLWANDDFDIIKDRFRTKVSAEDRNDRPHVVILGAGWGALNMLRKLHCDKYNVTVISPKNYFVFTPLLPGTTTGTLDFRSVMEPIRKYCRRSDAEQVRFIEAEATSIDPVTNKVHCTDNSLVKGSVTEFDIPYDHLVVAVGAETATFGIKGVAENACFMKGVEDTTKIRNRLLDCLETASIPGMPKEEVERLLNFVVVGGGPAGVEYASELYDFVKRDVRENFPELADHVKITLVEALPHILNMFDAKVIDYVESRFRELHGMKVLLNSAVNAVGPNELTIKTQKGEQLNMPYGLLVWVTGNAPRKIVTDLVTSVGGAQNNRRGLLTDEHMRVKGTNNIWALGDCTLTGLPATAQVASQEGRYLGRLFNEYAEQFHVEAKKARDNKALPALQITNKGDGAAISANSAMATAFVDSLGPALQSYNKFKYEHFGSFAYVGGHKAVAEFKRENKWTSTGMATFLLWRSVYLSKLLSTRNRILVGFDWMKSWIFGRDVSRT